MPDNVLRLAATGIGCCAALGFAMGLNSAGQRSRLPGEAIDVAGPPSLAAADARPISSDEIAPVEPELEKAEEKPGKPAAPLADASALKPPIKPIEVAPPPPVAVEPPPAADEPPH